MIAAAIPRLAIGDIANEQDIRESRSQEHLMTLGQRLQHAEDPAQGGGRVSDDRRRGELFADTARVATTLHRPCKRSSAKGSGKVAGPRTLDRSARDY